MNAHTTINAALIARGMMPMDGFCQCERCGVAGLNRDQIMTMKEGRDHIGKMYCEHCRALTYLEIDNPPPRKSPPACTHCNGVSPSSTYDYVRGKNITDHCQYC